VQGSVVEGRDTLIGNDLNNRLEGRGGKDDLTGGRGSDTLIGGDGDDVIHDDLDQTADTFTCGAGFDQVFLDLVDFRDGTITDCEKQAASAIDQHPNVAIKVGRVVRMDRHRRVHLRLACPRAQRHGCRHGRLTLARGKHKLGSRRYSLRRGKRTTISFKLSAREAARVRHRRRGVRFQATAREKDPKGRPKVTIAQFRLKAKH
jgi:RTX calcium-binding nonapeptide repeat (4 copies)